MGEAVVAQWVGLVVAAVDSEVDVVEDLVVDMVLLAVVQEGEHIPKSVYVAIAD